MSWDAWSIPNPKEEQSPTWGDYGKAAGSTVAGIGAGAAGLLREFYEQGRSEQGAGLWRSLQGAARTAGEDIQGSMTDEGRSRFQAGVTSEKFWEHPVSSIALKATGMTPYLAAAALPGVLVGEGAAALAATAAAGGTLGAGDVVESIYAKTDKMSDADLKEQSTLYRGLRADADETEARREYNQTLLGMKPAIAFALGVGSGAFGPAGNIIKGIRPGATAAAKGAGVLGHQGVMAAAGEGAVTELAEEGYGAYAGQKAEIEGGLRQKYDAKEIFDQALTGMVLGAGFGGVSGIGGGHGKGKAKANEIREAQEQRRGEDAVSAEVPAGETGVATEAEAPPTARAKAAASKKGVTVGVDPAIKAALDAEQAPAPPQPDLAEAAVPPTPTPPAPPDQLAPQAAQPPQAPTPPQGPAAGIIPEVTPGSTGSELGASTPSPSPIAEVATAPEIVPPSNAPLPSAVAQVPTAPVVTPVTQKEGGPPGPSGQATETAAETPIPAGPPVAEGEAAQPAKRNRKGPVVQAATAKRAEHAKNIYDAHRESLGETFGDKPGVKREAREEMAKKIDAILAKAAERGLVPRESLPDDVRVEKAGQTPEQKHQRAMSIPERASGDDISPHVIHLRELIGVRNALRGDKFGPKSEERARVNDFLAEYNVGEKGLALLAERRLVEGRRRKAVRGSGIAGAATKVTKGSEDLPGSEVRNVTEELRKQYEQPAAPKPAEKIAEIKEKAAEAAPAAAPKPAAKIAEIKEKAQPKITEKPKPAPKPEPTETVATEQQEEPLPRKVWHIIDTSQEGFHEGYKPVAEALNTVRRWVNDLSDADHAKLSKKPQLMLQDANSVDTVHKIGKWFKEDLGRGPFDGDTQIAAKAKAEQDEVVKDVIPEPVAKTKKQSVDMETKGILKGLGYTELDIRKMSFEEANEKADDGIAKEVTPEVTEEEGAPEGLTATQAAAFKKLTPAQQQNFKDLLAARKAASEEDVDDIVRMAGESKKSRAVEFEEGDEDIWDSPLHKARAMFGHDTNSISHSAKVSEVLKDMSLEHLEGAPKYIKDFVRSRLSEILGNTQIHFASADLIVDATGDTKAPLGYYHPGKGARPGYIVVQSDIGRNVKQYAHVIIHEALHAALHARISADPKLKARIEMLMKHLDENTKGLGEKKFARYALKDVHEFISEALSNPDLQQKMMDIVVSPELARKIGFVQAGDTIWGAFVNKVREMLKLPQGSFNLLERTLRVITPELEAAHADTSVGSAPMRLMGMDALRDAAIGKTADTRVNAKGKVQSYTDKVSRLWDMARRGAQLYGPSNPLNRMFETRAMMERAKDTILKKYGGLAASAKLAVAERLHPEAMRLGKEVYAAASLHDINLDGSNDHLGKDKLMGVQAKNEIAQLKKDWNNVALNPVRDTLRDAMKFFKDIHNAVSRETINNILAEANIHDKALAERIHMSGLTEADRQNFANTKLVSALDQVAALKHRHGSFMPFRRYGDYISAAEHELKVPTNATKINDNTLQFVDPTGKGGDARARAQVKTYLRGNDHTPQGNKLTPVQVQKVWVDKNNPTKLMEGTEPDAVPAYRVAMQTAHVEMHETQAAAENSQKDLEDAGLLNSRTHKREDAYKSDVTNIQSAMGTVLRSLEKQQRFIDADSTQKAAMREMFHDLSLGLSGTTSIKNSMRQRRNVAGMSKDLGRVTADYSRMTANHLAMLQYRPKLDAIFKEMRDYNDNHPDDKNRIRREEVYKEFIDRVYGKAAAEADKHTPGVISRVLQVTRLSFLAGPSFHLINAHEPWTTSMPAIGGDHGMARTAKALANAYNLIGGRAGVVAGLKDTAAAYTKDTGFTDYVKLFKDTISKNKTVGGDRARRLTDLFDYADARNLFSNSSIFEQAKFANAQGNIAGRALDRADLMANQVGTAIEAINRSVTLIPAYELQYKKNGGNHEAAMHYAFSKAQDTMGDYSAWNAAPAFNTTLGKPFLQFKKFPQKTYMLLGNIMGGVLKGDPAAMKQFAGLMVTHAMVAGVLGLPTEPFKLALIAANALGVTGFTPEDYEYAVRQLAARVAGQKGGEIISKGLYRGIGIELSGRMGLDSLLVRGAPKGTKDKDIKEFLFDTMAGASGSFLLNQVQGAQAAMKGDFATAVEKISPLRTVGDITKAAVGLAGDKKGPSGKVTQEQFTPYQALIRGLGMQPAAASELGALRGRQAHESRRLSANRSEIVNAWVDSTGADKVKVQRMVQEFNAGRDRDEQITQKDLTNAAARRKREEKVTEHGITTSKRTRAIDERAKSVFNP